MPSTYTSNNKIQKIATGEQSGTWGNTTNTNFDLFDTAIDGFVSITLSGTTHTLNIPDGSAGDGRNKVLVFTGTLAATNTISVTPNTVKKHYYVQNNTTGSQNIVLSQGSGSSVTVKPGYSSIVYLDGAGSGAAVKEVLTSLKLTALLEATGAVLNGSSSGSTTLQASATASGTLTLPAATDTLVGKATTDTFTNKTFDTAGTGNVLRINGTQVSAVTGTGSVVLATSPTLVTPLLGTPTSGTLTNCTGLPVSTGISGLGTNVATFLATPSSANLAGAVTDETGSGALVFANTPTLVTPVLGTPTSGTLTNCTGLPISTGVSGLGSGVATFLATPSSANLASAVTDETGTGGLVFATGPVLTSPTLVTANIGTPALGTLTNCTGLPVSTGISGLGSGVATFLATPSSANLAAAVTDETGTGALVFGTSPTIATPNVTGSLSLSGSRVLAFDGAGYSSTNIAVGLNALNAVTTAVNSSAFGSQAMLATTSGNNNAAFGRQALYTNSTGYENTAIGTQSLYFNSSGYANVALGQSALESNTSGNNNSAIGYKSLFLNTVAVQGTAVGNFSLYDVTTGNSNTAIGYNTGRGITTGSKNTIIGANVTGLSSTLSNTVILADGDGNQRVYIDSSGNVGIGTSSPSTYGLLTVSGGSATISPVLTIESTAFNTGQGCALAFARNGFTQPIQARIRTADNGYSASNLLFETKADGTAGALSERMRIDSSGNVGIGTSSPAAKLDVRGGNGTGGLTSPSGTWAAQVLMNQDTNAYNGLAVSNRYAASTSIILEAAMGFNGSAAGYYPVFTIDGLGQAIFKPQRTEAMRIDSSGNVGIGVSSPIKKLTVNGEMAISYGNAICFVDGGGTSTFTADKAIYCYYDGTYDRLQIQPSGVSSGIITFCAGAAAATRSEKMRIDSSGNVGIGTSSPSFLLDLYKASLPEMRINDGVTTFQCYVASGVVMGTVSNHPMSFRINATEQMRLDTNGYLLIGYTTSNGAYRLQVNSQIFATNATIATSDGRYKENISSIKSGLDVVGKLNPVSFTWKQHEIHNFDSGTQVGFIAQDVHAALADEPYLESIVKRNEVELKDGTKEEFYGLSDAKLIPILVKAIQELKAKIDILEARN